MRLLYVKTLLNLTKAELEGEECHDILIAHYPTIMEGFIQRTLEASK
jgi:hypothetical protein